MVNAKDIMTRDVVTLSPDTGIIDAARLLLETGFNGAPVVDENGKVYLNRSVLDVLRIDESLIEEEKNRQVAIIRARAEAY